MCGCVPWHDRDGAWSDRKQMWTLCWRACHLFCASGRSGNCCPSGVVRSCMHWWCNVLQQLSVWSLAESAWQCSVCIMACCAWLLRCLQDRWLELLLSCLMFMAYVSACVSACVSVPPCISQPKRPQVIDRHQLMLQRLGTPCMNDVAAVCWLHSGLADVGVLSPCGCCAGSRVEQVWCAR